MNSSFAIFMFSSIFLGSLSFLYNQWTKNAMKNHEIEQLDLEITLRINYILNLSTGKDKNTYSNLKNIQRVMDGCDSVFYIRKPIFDEFNRKNTTTLLWHLYLLVTSKEQKEVNRSIRYCVSINNLIRTTRFNAVEALPDRKESKDKNEEDKLEEEENIMRKDFGQQQLFAVISDLANIKRWKQIESAN